MKKIELLKNKYLTDATTSIQQKENPLFNKHNDYSKIHDYIKNNCAFECKYFILKKEKTND